MEANFWWIIYLLLAGYFPLIFFLFFLIISIYHCHLSTDWPWFSHNIFPLKWTFSAFAHHFYIFCSILYSCELLFPGNTFCCQYNNFIVISPFILSPFPTFSNERKKKTWKPFFYIYLYIIYMILFCLLIHRHHYLITNRCLFGRKVLSSMN